MLAWLVAAGGCWWLLLDVVAAVVVGGVVVVGVVVVVRFFFFLATAVPNFLSDRCVGNPSQNLRKPQNHLRKLSGKCMEIPHRFQSLMFYSTSTL